MNRNDIKIAFRAENPEITSRVVSNTLLNIWCESGDKEVCAITRCIVDQDGTTITTAEDDQYYDLTDKITKFYDIDEWPGGGVAYNNKRLVKKTIAELDDDTMSAWRERSSGTPKNYYRRGQWLYLDRPIDSNEYDLQIYAVLISDDFDDDDKTPYNQLTYLEPYHYGIVKYLQWKAKAKVGKPQEASIAMQEFSTYAAWMKKMIGGIRKVIIRFEPKV